jgi:hypothetical protein
MSKSDLCKVAFKGHIFVAAIEEIKIEKLRSGIFCGTCFMLFVLGTGGTLWRELGWLVFMILRSRKGVVGSGRLCSP